MKLMAFVKCNAMWMTFEDEIILHLLLFAVKKYFFFLFLLRHLFEHCQTLMECQIRNGYATHRICILMKERRPDEQP